MDTELYGILQDLLLESGLSKRKFSQIHNLSHAWLIEFMNPNKIFRPLQTKTMSILMKEFNIPKKVLFDYNAQILKERSA